jgi:hypothetical protein
MRVRCEGQFQRERFCGYLTDRFFRVTYFPSCCVTSKLPYLRHFAFGRPNDDLAFRARTCHLHVIEFPSVQAGAD